ncbi:MAG: HPP family protein [Mariniblastus sp.]
MTNFANEKSQRSHHFIRRRGGSLVEYVIVLQLVVGCVIASVYLVSSLSKSKFEMVAESIDAPLAESSPGFDAEGSTAPVVAIKERSATLAGQQLTGILILPSTILIGILYFRLALQRHREREEAGISRRAENKQTASRLSIALERINRKRTLMRRQIGDDWESIFNGDGKVGDFMSSGLFTICPSLPIEDAKQLLQEKGFRRVLVVHKDGRLAGIVSKKDLVAKTGTTVADVMTSEPLIVAPESKLSIALTMMLQARISCLPVVKDGYLCGLLSTSDLMMLLQCVLLILEEKCEEARARAASRVKRNSVSPAVQDNGSAATQVSTPQVPAG